MRVPFLAIALLLAACSGSDDGPAPGPAPGGVTRGEAAALNDAAAMLDADAVSANALAAQPGDGR